MRKILYLSHSPGLYGGEIALLTLMRHLDRQRFEPIVVLPGDGPLKVEFEKIGVRTFLCPLDRWIRFQWDCRSFDNGSDNAIARIAGIIRDESIDLVHSNSSVIHEGAVAAKLNGVPHVWHIHETLPDHPELTSLIPLNLTLHIIALLSDAIITVADAGQKQFREVGIHEKLITIHNGIDPGPFHLPLNISIRDELGISDNALLVVILGSVTERKGYRQLLEAARQVCNHLQNVQFLWVGQLHEPMRQDLADKVGELGLQEHFTHLDFRYDVPQILRSVDLLVLPSVNEAFPLVILEAMASGKPVVATRCGGTAESVDDGKTGFLVPVANPEALAEKILILARDVELRLAMGRRAAASFKKNFTANRYARNVEALYEQILAAPRRVQLTPAEQTLLQDTFQSYQNYSLCIDVLKNTREEFEQRQQIYSNLHATVAKRDCQFAAHHYHVAGLETLIAELQLQLTERNQRIANHLVLLDQMQIQIETTASELATQEALLQRVEQDRSRENQLAENRTTALRAELQSLKEELSQLHFESASRIQTLVHQLAERDAEIDEIYQSKSWKVTAPLRKASRLLIRK